jgi:hypothetical protein
VSAWRGMVVALTAEPAPTRARRTRGRVHQMLQLAQDAQQREAARYIGEASDALRIQAAYAARLYAEGCA